MLIVRMSVSIGILNKKTYVASTRARVKEGEEQRTKQTRECGCVRRNKAMSRLTHVVPFSKFSIETTLFEVFCQLDR